MSSQQSSSPSQQSSSSSPPPYIGNISQAPQYMTFNTNIHRGYRIGFTSFKQIIQTLFQLHNQSINIWSHLFAAICIFIIISIFFIRIDSLEIKYNNQQIYQNYHIIIQQYHSFINNFTFQQQLQYQNINYSFPLQTINSIQQQNIINNQSKNNQNSKQIYQIIKQLKIQLQLLFFINNTNNYKHFNINKILQKISIFLKNKQQQQISRIPILIFLICSSICLSCSTTFHLFYPISSKIHKILLQLDYAGVNILIIGSNYPPLYYGMYCQFQIAMFYLTIITIVGLSIFIILLIWLPKPNNRNTKPLLYVVFSVIICIPMFHLLINEYYFDSYGDDFKFTNAFPFYILLGISYLGGLYILTIRCPERQTPKKYDYCGHSHQIWHILVVLGIIFTYIGSIINYETRKMCPCPQN